MDSNYPNRIDNFQTKENEQGAQYDPQETTVQFAEDINKTNGAIKNVQETLGVNPAGKYKSVSEYLINIDEIANKPVEILTKFDINSITYSNGNLVFNVGRAWLRVGDRLVITPTAKVSIPYDEWSFSIYLTTDYRVAVIMTSMDDIAQDPENDLLLPIAEMYIYYLDGKVQFDYSNYFSGALFQPYINSKTVGSALSNNNYGTKNIGTPITQNGLTPGMNYVAFLQIFRCECDDSIYIIANGDQDNEVPLEPNSANASSQFVMVPFRADADGKVKIEFTADIPSGSNALIGQTLYYLCPIDDWN